MEQRISDFMDEGRKETAAVTRVVVSAGQPQGERPTASLEEAEPKSGQRSAGATIEMVRALMLWR